MVITLRKNKVRFFKPQKYFKPKSVWVLNAWDAGNSPLNTPYSNNYVQGNRGCYRQQLHYLHASRAHRPGNKHFVVSLLYKILRFVFHFHNTCLRVINTEALVRTEKKFVKPFEAAFIAELVIISTLFGFWGSRNHGSQKSQIGSRIKSNNR